MKRVFLVVVAMMFLGCTSNDCSCVVEHRDGDGNLILSNTELFDFKESCNDIQPKDLGIPSQDTNSYKLSCQEM
jgi:hypothetical protein